VTEKTDLFETYVRLRTLVAYLGEKQQLGWWDTSYLNPTGRKYLEINFPRSALAAGVAAAGSAAKRLHDARIGRSRVYHLFRLPFQVEQRVHGRFMRADAQLLWDTLQGADKALRELRGLAEATLEAPEGPVQVGTERHILSERGVSELAKHYLSAFTRRRVCLPYFTAEVKQV
jgi:hypothetical protein